MCGEALPVALSDRSAPARSSPAWLGWWAENQLPRQFLKHGRALWGFGGFVGQPCRPRNRRKTRPAKQCELT
jgi:hypothetical protein